MITQETLDRFWRLYELGQYLLDYHGDSVIQREYGEHPAEIVEVHSEVRKAFHTLRVSMPIDGVSKQPAIFSYRSMPRRISFLGWLLLPRRTESFWEEWTQHLEQVSQKLNKIVVVVDPERKVDLTAW